MVPKKSAHRAAKASKSRSTRSANAARVVPAPTEILPAGTKAPPFTLRSAPDKTVSLGDFGGNAVILAFYPADWSPTCGDQLALYNEVLPEFQRFNATLLGISVDSAWCHAAYAKARNFHFPLLADFEPKGAVAKAYGAYAQSAGMNARALFVVDAMGIIRWSYLSPMGVNPGADGILAALEALSAATPASRRTAPTDTPARPGGRDAGTPSARSRAHRSERTAR